MAQNRVENAIRQIKYRSQNKGDYFPAQHLHIRFYNRDEVCLLHGTRSVLTCKFSSGDLSSQRPGFDLWPVRVRFVVDKAQRQFSVPGLRFSPVNIIRQRSLLTVILNAIGRSLQTSKQSSLVLCEISVFRYGAVEAFVLLEPYGSYNGLEAIRGALGRRVSLQIAGHAVADKHFTQLLFAFDTSQTSYLHA
jgi:hypothetical protein